MVDNDISEAEDEPKAETVSEAESFEDVALDCSVCIPPDTVDGVPDGVEAVISSAELTISEVWVAGPGVNVAEALVGLEDRNVDRVTLATVTGSVLLAFKVVPGRSAVLEVLVVFMPEVTSDGA